MNFYATIIHELGHALEDYYSSLKLEDYIFDTFYKDLAQRRLKKVDDTVEVLIILSGVLKIDFYTESRKYIFSKTARKNDIVILLTGGHGFKIMKNCKMIEVKQGPYNPKKDKFKF